MLARCGGPRPSRIHLQSPRRVQPWLEPDSYITEPPNLRGIGLVNVAKDLSGLSNEILMPIYSTAEQVLKLGIPDPELAAVSYLCTNHDFHKI